MKFRHIVLFGATALLTAGCTSAISLKPVSDSQAVDAKTFENQIDFLLSSNPLFLASENPVAYSYELEMIMNSTEETSYKSPFNENLLYKDETATESKSVAKYDAINCLMSQTQEGKTTTTKPESKTVTTSQSDMQIQAGNGVAYTINSLKNVYTAYTTENPLQYIQTTAISGVRTYSTLIKSAAATEGATCYIGNSVYTVKMAKQTASESTASSENVTLQLVVTDNSFSIVLEETLSETNFNTKHEYYTLKGSTQIKVTRKAVTLSRKDMTNLVEEKSTTPYINSQFINDYNNYNAPVID